MKAEGRRQTAEVTTGNHVRFGGGALLPSAFCLLLFLCLLPSCRTVGVSKTSGGYAEINPTIAAESRKSGFCLPLER